MDQFQASLKVKKIESDTKKILIDNLVNDVADYSRNVGEDGKEFVLLNADGEKNIPVGEYSEIEFLYLSSKWAETDTTDAANPIVMGNPAPVELQFSTGGTWISLSQLTLQGKTDIEYLKIRNPNTSGKKIKIEYIIGANS